MLLIRIRHLSQRMPSVHISTNPRTAIQIHIPHPRLIARIHQSHQPDIRFHFQTSLATEAFTQHPRISAPTLRPQFLDLSRSSESSKMIAGALRRVTSTSVTKASKILHPASFQPWFTRSAPTQVARRFAAKSDASSLIPEVKPGKPGEMPDIMEQATGLERAEIEHPDLFKHNEVLRGPFGTTENPVKIQSAYDSRIVGCTGRAAPNDHDLVWINVVKGQQWICSECGQVFELDPL